MIGVLAKTQFYKEKIVYPEWKISAVGHAHITQVVDAEFEELPEGIDQVGLIS